MPAMSTIDLLWGFSDDPNMRKTMLAFTANVNKAAKVSKWMLCNSFYELEPAFHDQFPNILSVGPLLASDRLGHPKGQLLPEDSTCISWLDHQPVQSVIYAAFGSSTIFNQSQFIELLHGLELVNQPLLWVVRHGLIDDFSRSSLEGFKDRISHRGKIVDWAPQQEVLAHPSIACFITHCGWNSTMEGLSQGVPLLCWPYVVDQFHDANHICDILKVGLRFTKDENRIVARSEIKIKVKELLADEGIRSRVNNLKDVAQKTISEGGSSSENIEDFINKIRSNIVS
ncbi:Udp-glycosyltransferase [Thalictrum thalictroides]|uniref:Udp-glycosyltransferase n=1 Tax=Thalictrum thalictroides TaxID=46969 RepID=A0A7J6W126_THATH|nr:Udp-glycosyltransferase [Thalictrum thalictroides]